VRIVADTNVFVSYLLLRRSIPAEAVDRTLSREQILVSDDTMRELSEVLARPKFDKYVSLGERDSFVAMIKETAVWVPIIRRIRACRDPRDDKFLELAINGSADAILTGDEDLLDLHPFQGIAILTPAAWLHTYPD
jgi:putative PIN family toxin of toxin-antitoxin system